MTTTDIEFQFPLLIVNFLNQAFGYIQIIKFSNSFKVLVHFRILKKSIFFCIFQLLRRLKIFSKNIFKKFEL